MSAGLLIAPARLDLPDAPCPFRGLVPFSERDAAYFFGRTAEREIIAANLIASPLTLLYSASGVGKSSVLRAGVMRDLRESARESIRPRFGPEYIPAIVRDWRLDPLGALRRGLVEGVRGVLGDEAADEPVDADDAAGEIAAWSERTDATMLVILDQFEEFLLYHGEHWEPGEPAVELAAALCLDSRQAAFLLALREDSIAGLDRFKGRVPGLFDNYLRLRQLSVREAASAITGPIGRWNERHPDDPMDVEDELVAEVLSQVGDGRLALPGAGQGRPSGTTDGGVEAPFLQLVMTRVWEEERRKGSTLLRRETLVAKLGGARKIVASYLDTQMERLSREERDVASDVFHQLVTPSGAKVARSVGDLTAYTGASPEMLGDVLGKLSQGEEWRILRPEPDPRGGPVSYEIFHDVLAEPVLDWRSRHEAARAGDRAVDASRARNRRRVLWGLVALAILAALATLGVLYLFSARHQKLQAQQARIAADAGAAVSASRIALTSDPELSVLLVEEALKLDRSSPAAKSALRAALGDDRSLGVLAHGTEGWGDVGISPDGSLASATFEDGRVHVWRVSDRKQLYKAEDSYGQPAFDPRGSRVAVPRYAGVDLVTASTGRVITRLSGSSNAYGVVWTPDGSRLLGLCGGDLCAWSGDDGRRLSRVPTSYRDGMLLWADSRHALVYDGSSLVLLDQRTGAVLHRMSDAKIDSFAVRRDGGMAFIGSGGSVRTWNLRTGATRTLPGRDMGWVIETDEHGKHVLMTGNGGHVRVLNTRTGQPSAFLNGHSADVANGWINGTGRIAVTVAADRTARVWDARSGTQLAVLGGHNAAVSDVAVAESGTAITVDMAGVVRLWRLWPSSGARLRAPDAHISSAQLGEDGRTVVAATDKGVRAWDTVAGAATAPRSLGSTRAVRSATLGPDGRSVLVVGARRADVLSLADGRPIGAWMGAAMARDNVTRAVFSPDGKLIATAQRDGGARLWAAGDHRFIRRLGLPGAPSAAVELKDIAFSDDSRLVAIGGADRLVRVYDARTGEKVNTYKLPSRGASELVDPSTIKGAVEAVALQPQGTLVAAGDDEGLVHFWDLKDSKVQRVVTAGSHISALAFSPDGTLLATAGGRDAKLWDVSTGQVVSTLALGVSSVTGIRFSDDGSRIVLTTEGQIRLIDCKLCGSVKQLRDEAKRLLRNRRLTAEERATNLPKGFRGVSPRKGR